MDSDWASGHLQVIRTLMERAAVYRRALAPIMLSVGFFGTVTAGVALGTRRFETNRTFAALWFITAIVSLITAYLLVRRQAMKEQDPFWSPPTRRVTQALVPGFVGGGMAGIVALIAGQELPSFAWLLATAWVIVYGTALHGAGFFMERGIKLFGLTCVGLASLVLIVLSLTPSFRTAQAAHAVMGSFFGLLHLAYGAYLHFTERRG